MFVLVILIKLFSVAVKIICTVSWTALRLVEDLSQILTNDA
jgi:hypothetical protein